MNAVAVECAGCRAFLGVDIKACVACGGDHSLLFRHRGHQGRNHYVFCPATNRATVVHLDGEPRHGATCAACEPEQPNVRG